MSSEQLKVVPIKLPVHQDAVDLIRDLLKDAETGVITEIHYVARLNDGTQMTGGTPSTRIMETIGRLSRLIHNLHLLLDKSSD